MPPGNRTLENPATGRCLVTAKLMSQTTVRARGGTGVSPLQPGADAGLSISKIRIDSNNITRFGNKVNVPDDRDGFSEW